MNQIWKWHKNILILRIILQCCGRNAVIHLAFVLSWWQNTLFRATRACLVLVINKNIFIYIYIYVTTMCFKENYCMIQQGYSIFFFPIFPVTRICWLEWLLRQELTMKWVCHTNMANFLMGVQNPLRYLSQKRITQFFLLFLSVPIS